MALDEVGIRYIVAGVEEAIRQLNGVADSEERAASSAEKLQKPTQDAANSQKQLASETNVAKTALSGITQVAGRAGVDIGTFSTITGKAVDALQSFASGGAGLELALLGLGTAVGLAGAAAVNLAVEWESSLTKISNDANLTDEQARAVGDGLRQMSGEFVYSATEMADAVASVGGKWQLYTGETLDAKSATDLVRVSAKLAQADGASLEGTMKALTNVMAAYKLPVQEASRVTDILNNTGDATGASVQSLASGLDRLQARLGTLAPPIEETATLVAQLSANGLEGNRAMMIVVSALNSLEGGSEEVNAKLAELGITVFDSSGEFVGLRSVIEQLSPAIEGMTDKQAKATLATLFGSGAAGVMSGVLAGGVETWDRYATAIGQTGTTEEEYARTQETTAVKLKEFKIQVEEFARSVGENLVGKLIQVKDAFAPLAEMIGAVISAWSRLPGPIRDSISTITILYGGLLLLKAAYAALHGPFALVTSLFHANTAAAAANASATGAMGLSIGAAVPYLAAATAGFVLLNGVVKAFTGTSITEFFSDLFGGGPSVVEKATEQMKKFREASSLLTDEEALAKAHSDFQYLITDAERLQGLSTKDYGGGTGSPTALAEREAEQNYLKQAKADARELGEIDKERHATISQIVRAHESLTPILQAEYDAGVNYEAIQNKINASLKNGIKLNEENVDALGNVILSQSRIWKIQQDAQADSEKAVQSNTSALKTWNEEQAASAKALSEVNTALSNISDKLLAQNSVYQSNQMQIDLLTIAIDTLKASKDADSDATKAQIKTLENQRSALQSANKVVEDYDSAIKNLALHVGGELSKSFADGKESMANFAAAEVGLGRDSKQVYGDLTLIQRMLDTTDSSVAIGEMYKLKASMSPEQWDAFISTVGPHLIQQIALGIKDPVARKGLYDEANAADIKITEGISVGVTVGTPVTESVTGAVDDALVAAGNDQAQKSEGLGKDIVGGVVVGIQQNQSNLPTALSIAVEDAIEAARNILNAQSPSKVTADEIGKPMAEGIAQGIVEGVDPVKEVIDNLVVEAVASGKETAKKESKDVGTAFIDSVTEAFTNNDAVAKYGDAGAEVLQALTAAMEDEAGASEGQALARIVDSLVDSATDEGVPNAKELGEALVEAIATAIRDKTPEAVQAAIDLAIELGGAAAKAVSLTMDAIDEEIAKLDKAEAREKDLGSAGVRFMDTLVEAITKGGKDAVENVASAANDIVDSLKDKLEPAQAAYVSGAFMDALNRAITEKSPESLAALEDWFRKIATIEDGGVVDITNGMIYTADQIKAIADKIGIGVGDVVDNFSMLVSSGILGMADAIAAAPEMVSGVIQKILSDLDSGIIDAATAVASLKSVLNGGSGVVQPPETTGGGSGAYNPGTDTAFSGEDVQTFATRILGFNPYTSTTQYLADLNGFRLTADDITSTVLHAGAAGLRALRVVTTAAYDPNNPSTQAPQRLPVQAITPMALGSPWVPDGLVARLHQGERVLSPSANSFFSSLFGFGEWGPRSVLASLSRMAGASGQTSSLTVDMRHSTFSGSPEENAAAFEEAAQRVIDRNWGRNALLSGVR